MFNSISFALSVEKEQNNSSREPATSAPSPLADNSTIRMMTPGEMPSMSGLAYGDPTTVGTNQLVSHGPPDSNDVSSSFSLTTSPHLYCFPTANENFVGDFIQRNWIEASRVADHIQHVNDRSGMAEAEGSYSGSGVAPGPTARAGSPSHIGASNIPSEHSPQQSFEEQMMLAIALSLADVHQSQVHTEQNGSSNK